VGRLCWEPLGAYLAATDTVSDGIAHANINREVAHIYSIGLFDCFARASASAIPEKRAAI